MKQKAKEMRHWETVRDCDRFECIVTKNKDLLISVYFGTPFASFRERLLPILKSEVVIPEVFFWGHVPAGAGAATPAKLDVGGCGYDRRGGCFGFGEEAEGSSGSEHSRSPSLAHPLRGFYYSPFRMRALYAHLFPTEPYDPSTSDQRVLETLEELARWFATNKIAVRVFEQDDAYRFVFTGPVAVKVRRKSNSSRR